MRRDNGGANKAQKYGKSKDSNVKRQQPRKDSKVKRVNCDNERESKFDKQYMKDSRREEANDVSWYNANPELLKSAGSLPFASMLGDPVMPNVSSPGGVVRLSWCPAIGGESGIPINQAFKSMYSYIVHANSRNYNYDPADLGILVIAGSQVFSIIAAIIRAYGVAKYYQERNYFFPDATLRLLGFNPNDMRANMGNLWFQINNLIDQTRQIWIPNTLPIFDRWIWLNSNLFTDAEGPTAQTYVFQQDAYFIYTETLSDKGGMLVTATVDGDGTSGELFRPTHVQQGYPVSTWINVAQNMITALVNSQDRGMIFGDILNAYSAEKIRAMSPISSDFIVVPQYNSEVLTQVENWVATDKTINAIGQIDGEVVMGWARNQAPGVESTLIYNIKHAVLNFHTNVQPTPEQVMVATRMMAGGYIQGDNVKWFDRDSKTWNSGKFVGLRCFGSELPHELVMVRINPTRDVLFDLVNQVLPDSIDDVAHMAEWCAMMSFDWHPFFYRTKQPLKVVESTGEVKVNAFEIDAYAAYGDYDNYISVDWDTIKKLHKTALFSLWGVPHI